MCSVVEFLDDSSLPFPEDVGAGIEQYPEKVRAEARSSPKSVDSPVQFHECILNRIFGILLPTEHTAGSTQKRLFITLVDHTVGAQVSLAAFLDYLLFL